MGDPTGYHWRRLACAVIVQAAKDAQSGNGTATEARASLRGEWCGFLLDSVNLDRGAVAAWVDGLPAVAQPALPGMN